MQNMNNVTAQECSLGVRPPVAVDFETHYAADYSVKDMGNRAYCNDPRFNAWAVSVYDGATTWAGRPKDFDWQSLHGREWVSHHREFDKAVFERLQRDGSSPRRSRPWSGTARRRRAPSTSSPAT